MTISDLAAILAATVFAAVVGFLVSVLIRVRKSVAEAGRLLARMNADLPLVIADVRAMCGRVTELLDRVQTEADHVSGMLHVVGTVGESVQRVHTFARRLNGRVVRSVAGVLSAVKAATQVLAGRWHQRRERKRFRCVTGGEEDRRAALTRA